MGQGLGQQQYWKPTGCGGLKSLAPSKHHAELAVHMIATDSSWWHHGMNWVQAVHLSVL